MSNGTQESGKGTDPREILVAVLIALALVAWGYRQWKKDQGPDYRYEPPAQTAKTDSKNDGKSPLVSVIIVVVVVIGAIWWCAESSTNTADAAWYTALGEHALGLGIVFIAIMLMLTMVTGFMSSLVKP